MSSDDRMCENPKHIGDPKENHGTGSWWLKDPEWELWCPNCSSRDFIERLKKELQKYVPKEA